jgi:hypothetical protein
MLKNHPPSVKSPPPTQLPASSLTPACHVDPSLFILNDICAAKNIDVTSELGRDLQKHWCTIALLLQGENESSSDADSNLSVTLNYMHENRITDDSPLGEILLELVGSQNTCSTAANIGDSSSSSSSSWAVSGPPSTKPKHIRPDIRQTKLRTACSQTKQGATVPSAAKGCLKKQSSITKKSIGGLFGGVPVNITMVSFSSVANIINPDGSTSHEKIIIPPKND